MRKEYEIVVADTSCLILLDKIGELDLLESIFRRITVTPEIAAEYGRESPKWVTVRRAENKNLQHTLDLDLGEATAIALALEIPSVLLVVDDYKARKVAQRLGLMIIGSLGVLLRQKITGPLNG